MKTSSITPAGRIMLLYKHYLSLNSKQFIMGLGAMICSIIGVHSYFLYKKMDHLSPAQSDSNYHIVWFVTAFVLFGLLWCGNSFPALRSREKSMGYLLLPASTFEKFLFEFINRIILFVICFPMIYWATTNLVVNLFYMYNPAYGEYWFSFESIFKNIGRLELGIVLSLGSLMFTLSFAGATYFRKMPLIKTIIAVFIIISAYVVLAYLAVTVLNLTEYAPSHHRILFMRSEEDATKAGIAAAMVVNIILLMISYFKLKEKEA